MKRKYCTILSLLLISIIFSMSSCQNNNNITANGEHEYFNIIFENNFLHLSYNDKKIEKQIVLLGKVQDYYVLYFKDILPFEKETSINNIQLNQNKSEQRNYFSGEYQSKTGQKITYSGYITLIDGQMSKTSVLKLDLVDEPDK